MVALSFFWLLLMIVEFTAGLSRPFQVMVYVIWVLFGLDFILQFWIAPHKRRFLLSHWLTGLSLLLPALRIFRVLRPLRALNTLRAGRSLSLLRVLTSMNRGISTVRRTMKRRGIGYLFVLTAVVTFSGAAGMARFESPEAVAEAERPGEGLGDYWEALWWTGMIMTTMGSEYWPKTLEGRILAWLLSVYAFTIFGYITATIASHFIGIDVESSKSRKKD